MVDEPRLLSELKPAPYNPRRIDAASRDALRVSLSKFGDISGIVWNKNTGHLVTGHQRIDQLKALYKDNLKIESGNIIAPDGNVFKLRVVEWSESDERAANIAANSIYLAGEFTDTLDDVLQELKSIEYADYETLRLNELLNIDEVLSGESNPDDVPEPEEETISKLGDLWIMGNHRLLVGDCTKESDVKRVMNGKIANMSWTDPPYGVNYQNHGHPSWGKHKPIKNDNLSEDEMYEFWGKAFNISSRFNSGDIYIAAPSGPLVSVLDSAIKEKTAYERHQWLVWVKDRFVLGRSNYHYRHEHILYGWRKNGKSSWSSGRDQDSVFEVSRPAKSDEHPTMKPVELIVQMIKNSSVRGDIVYEPFSGSGSTMIACEMLERSCYGIEISPAYVDVAVKRWEIFSGKTAVLENVG